MPQLDLATFPSQIFWIILCFWLFYLIVSRFVLPKIGKVFDNRLDHINILLKRADQLKKQASEVMRESKSLLEDIRLQEKAKLDQATLLAREQLASSQQRLEKEYNKKLTKVLNDLAKQAEDVSNQTEKEALAIANEFLEHQ